MGKKIFVSYKYADSLVYNLPGNYFTTARHYVTELQSRLALDDHIYKGENDGEDLSQFKDPTIASKIKDKIYDSSITLVFVSRGLKEAYKSEGDQWIPWEISYSLKELSRDGITSRTNAVMAIVLPDEINSYSYFINYDPNCNCTNHNTNFLFQILRDNMFNQKAPTTHHCNGQLVYTGEYSYIKCVKWVDFIGDIQKYLTIAESIKLNKDQYNITKTIK